MYYLCVRKNKADLSILASSHNEQKCRAEYSGKERIKVWLINA